MSYTLSYMLKNIITATDSYKLTHHNQYPEGLEGINSYFEARAGSAFPSTVIFGPPSFARELSKVRVTQEMVEEAEDLVAQHFGDRSLFNRGMWEHIIRQHQGRLPVRIRSAPEGWVVQNSNVLLTIENTDPLCAPLVNHLETILTHIWHPMNVATISFEARKVLKEFLDRTEGRDNPEAMEHLKFMLHDFGYRGSNSLESAGRGGAAHLTSFYGTDTLAAIHFIRENYKDGPDYCPAFSVPATEHSVMTAEGREGEMGVVQRLLDRYPKGVLSVVSDSYDIFEACRQYGTRFKEQILARDGKFVVRPDSGDPVQVTLEVLEILGQFFGHTSNSKGYLNLPPQLGVLWGDGIDVQAMRRILMAMLARGWSAKNIVFGMGGGLHQKHDRDTQRFAFKASAMKVNGKWRDLQKSPVHGGKASKPGRLKLCRTGNVFHTEQVGGPGYDELVTIFEDGEALTDNFLSFEEVRANVRKFT